MPQDQINKSSTAVSTDMMVCSVMTW